MQKLLLSSAHRWQFLGKQLRIRKGTLKIKSKLHYTPGISQMRVASGGAYLRGLAPGQHNSTETSQRWRAIGDAVSNLTDPEIEPQTSRTDRACLATEVNGRCKGTSVMTIRKLEKTPVRNDFSP